MNIENSELTREMQNDLNRERLNNLWQKYRKTILLFVAVSIIFVIVVLVYVSYTKGQRLKYSEMLNNAIVLLDSGNNRDSARKTLKSMHNNNSIPSNIRFLASMNYGKILFNDGKVEEAISTYLEINKDADNDPYIRETAGLYALKIMIDSDDRSFDQRIENLVMDLENSSTYLKYFIIEQKAIYQWHRQNYKMASDIFDNLSQNPEASDFIRSRARQMKDIISQRK